MPAVKSIVKMVGDKKPPSKDILKNRLPDRSRCIYGYHNIIFRLILPDLLRSLTILLSGLPSSYGSTIVSARGETVVLFTGLF